MIVWPNGNTDRSEFVTININTDLHRDHTFSKCTISVNKHQVWPNCGGWSGKNGNFGTSLKGGRGDWCSQVVAGVWGVHTGNTTFTINADTGEIILWYLVTARLETAGKRRKVQKSNMLNSKYSHKINLAFSCSYQRCVWWYPAFRRATPYSLNVHADTNSRRNDRTVHVTKES